MNSVHEILNNTRVFGDFHTHVSMIQPMGKFNISRNAIEEFWDKYCEAVYEDDEKISYGIAEKLQTYIPILVDIDIKVPYTEDKDIKRLYAKEQLEDIVRTYQEVIRTIVNDYNSNHSICFSLEKPAYKVTSGSGSEYIKSGFHLHFPYVFMSKTDHEAHLIPRVKKFLDKTKIFQNLGFVKSDEFLDSCYVKNPWLLYGSKKSDTMDSYKLSCIYNEDRDEMTIEDALKDYKIYDSEENEIPLIHNYTYYLPRILSVIPWHRQVVEIKPNIPSVIKLSNSNMIESEKKKTYITKNLNETLEKAKKYMSILSEERSSNYSTWMQVGWAVYNISNGNENGLNLWLEFSSKCGDKFNEAECISLWDKMTPKNMTIGTIMHFAKEDNILEYNKIIKLYTENYIKESLEGSHHDLAKALYERYGTEFICASIAQNIWYQYENHRWKRIEEGVFLRQKISQEIVKIFEDKQSELFAKMSKSAESERNIYGVQIKLVQKMIKQLKSHPFKVNVMKECKDVFYVETFLKTLDNNPWLIGFRNGIYDLEKNIFRSGIPEDFISLQMPIEYSDYTEDDSLVKDVYDFFQKIFPDKQVRDYFMDISSDVFVGGNRRKHVYFWSGEGDNGKSITELFFEKMLGEYAIKLPTSLVVGKRTQSSAACPELVRAGNGVRWAILQEPDKKDVINIGILKELSGNDTFFARGLFQAGGEIQPMFKLSVICNDPPSVPYSDKATWNRIRVIPFESTFTKNAPDTFEEQLLLKRFPIDMNFSEKIPSLIKPFAWVLLNHRKKGNTFVEPEKVRFATESYRKKNDSYQQFIEECVIMDQTKKLALPDLYSKFKEWHRESFPGQLVPVKGDVKEYYTKVWGEPEKGVWKGKKLITIEDQLERGEALILSEKDLDVENN
jgi:P4 family phage/plasmid primase-like protien